MKTKTTKVVDMLAYEHKYYKQGFKVIAGVDEVGRGCWAGPVVACACIFPKDYQNKQIKDSKVLSIAKREQLAEVIKKDCLAYAIAFVDAPRIDIINIKQASIEAMTKAVSKIELTPDCVLVDAETLDIKKTLVVPIIKGDAKSTSIAAASIVAKVYRDKLLDNLDQQYPQYGFKKNKGYGTILHLNALRKYGPIKSIHRFSYRPIKEVTKEKQNEKN